MGMVGAQAYPLSALAPRFLLHTSFLSPLFVLWLWTKPMARDFLHQAPFGSTSFSLCVWKWEAGQLGPPLATPDSETKGGVRPGGGSWGRGQPH